MALRPKYTYILLFLITSFIQNASSQNLQVTINKKAGQEGRTISPVLFTVVFSAPINVGSFSSATIKLSGTALGKTITAITQEVPNDGTTFEVRVTTSSNEGTVVAEIPAALTTYTSVTLGTTGSKPQGITLDGSGNIYTANSGSNNVSKITPAGVSSVFGITGSHPYGITIDPSGNLFTANAYSGSITKLTPFGVPSTFATTDSHPYHINMDNIGNFYMTNLYAGTLSKITSAGVSTSPFGYTGSSPFDLTIDAAGNVYTANYGSNDVSKITTDGVSAIVGTTGNGPDGIIIDPSGNLYTSNLYDNTVTLINAGGVSSVFGSTGSGPTAIIIDAAGNLYTANGGSANVSKISPSGVSTIIGTTGNNPVSITVDASENLYTANNGDNTVSKLIPSGISLFGSTTPSNTASTSTDNIYVLPVNLLYFKADYNNCATVFTWQIASEINSSYYSIQSSRDGTSFTDAATIANKNNPQDAAYEYTFKEIIIGNNYFRLKITDANGNYFFSKIILIKATDNCFVNDQLTVSPNPADDFVIIKGMISGTHLNLFNAAGIFLSSTEVNSSTKRLNISQYAKGIYILRIKSSNGTVQTVKILKQ